MALRLEIENSLPCDHRSVQQNDNIKAFKD